jgi:hypothetical protein
MLAIDKQTLPCANETELMQLLYTMLDRKRFGMVYDEATAEQREDLMRELEHAMQTTKHLAGHLREIDKIRKEVRATRRLIGDEV